VAIELAGYRRWEGRLRPPGLACWPIVRTGVKLVLTRKIFWFLFAAGLLVFLRLFVIIYIKAQITVENPMFSRFLDRFELTGTGEAYHRFMEAQGIVTMLLLAFAGSLLIGRDYQQGGLMFYLSRPIGRRHYVIGKLLAIGSVVLLITTFPALILYFEYGVFSNSLSYFRENPRILAGILGYGGLMAITLSLLLAGIASWVPRTVPLVMSWSCIFLLVPALSDVMEHVSDNNHWLLLNIWNDLQLLGRWCFGSIRNQRHEDELIGWAGWIVLGVCTLSALAFLRRVRAVEIVR
jgi:ABC-2 type transport system permease protein